MSELDQGLEELARRDGEDVAGFLLKRGYTLLSELTRVKGELAELKKYTEGGLRERPCLCGLVALEWYDFCPRCGRELPIIPSNDPPKTHVLQAGRTLCGRNWTWLGRKHPNDKWVIINDKENYEHVNCQGCKLGLEELGPPI